MPFLDRASSGDFAEASAGIEPAVRVLQFSARPSLAFADARTVANDGRRMAANDGERLLKGYWATLNYFRWPLAKQCVVCHESPDLLHVNWDFALGTSAERE